LFEQPEGPFLIFIGDEFWRAFGAAEVQRPTQCVVRPGRKQAIQIQRAARLGTSAGKTLPTEGLYADHRPDDVSIDVKVTHPGTLDNLGDRLVYARMHAEGQAVARGVDLIKQGVQLGATVTQYVQYRAEDLLLQLIEALQLDQRRHYIGAMGAFMFIDARHLMNRSALFTHVLQMPFDGFARLLVDDRADIHRQPLRVAHFRLGHGALEHVDDAFGYLFLNAEDAQGGTALPGAIESGGHDIHDDLLGQRGRGDEHRVRPTGFSDQRNASTMLIQASGNTALQDRGDRSRAGKPHPAYSLVCHQACTDGFATAR